MKAHPRIRKVVKWGGAAVTGLLVVLWVGSGWFVGGWQVAGEYVIGVGHGEFGVMHLSEAGIAIVGKMTGLEGERPFRLESSFEWIEKTRAAFWNLRFPGWALALLVLLPTLGAWRLDILARRRARVGHCPKCNYDLAGLAAGAVCPECGAGLT